MQKMDTEWALKLLAQRANYGDGTLYMETGKYKPWSMPVICALRRRGYRVDKIGQSAFRLFSKG